MSMKKTLLTVAAIASMMTAAAEGYQINTLSAKQGGMAHTGVALKLGSESMYFNPAGMAFMDQAFDASASINGVSATAKVDHKGETFETDNKVSTPIFVNAGFSIYDNLKAGVSFYTPYGSGINWGENWAGAILNQQVKLAVYTIQPTLSWRITPKLSVGAGLCMSWGTVDLSKGLVNPSTLDVMLQAMGIQYAFGSTMPASINLKGTSEYGWGFNVGAMYDISDRVTVGASFRSKMNMRVKKGEASLSYANEIARQVLQGELDVIDKANFKAEMPMPAVLTFGVGYKPLDKLTLAFDAQLTFWSAYKQLDIEFLDEKVAAYDQSLVKDYKNSWAFRLGAQYGLTNRFDIRGGLILDLSPVNKNHYNPETPGMTKIEPSLGLSFRPVKGLSIDLSVLYVAGLGCDGAKGDYVDLLAAKMQNPVIPVNRVFEADYRVHAVVPSLGISYSF